MGDPSGSHSDVDDRDREEADGGSPGGTMTLAFALSAVQALRRPTAVFEDARRWSRHVGILANDDDAVERFCEAHDLDPDFRPDGRDLWLALSEVRQATATDRHVLVGTDPEHRRAADHLDWEYRSVEEAARKAEWDLGDGDGGSGESGGEGLLGRLVELVRPAGE